VAASVGVLIGMPDCTQQSTIVSFMIQAGPRRSGVFGYKAQYSLQHMLIVLFVCFGPPAIRSVARQAC